MIIGPSAPNGPPVPIEIADEISLRSATFGSITLRPRGIASSAFGNSVSANFFRPVPRHQTNNYRAGDRRSDDPDSEMIMLERAELGRESLEKNDIGNFGIQPKKGFGHTALMIATARVSALRISIRASVRKSPSNVDEVLNPDI
jgi:hypothetical protein